MKLKKVIILSFVFMLFISITYAIPTELNQTISGLSYTNNDNSGQYGADWTHNTSGYNITALSFGDAGGDQHTYGCIYNGTSYDLMACTPLTDIGSYLYGDSINFEWVAGATYIVTGLRNGSSQRTAYVNPASFPYYPNEQLDIGGWSDATSLGTSNPPNKAEFTDSNFMMDIQVLHFINSTPSSPPPPPPTSASVTCSVNVSSSSKHTENPFYFGLNCIGGVVETTDLWDVKLYLNDTLNATTSGIALNTSVFTLNLTYGDEEVGYDLNVTITHGSDNANDSIQVTDVFIDSIQPDYNLTGIRSVYYKNDTASDFFYNITAYDPNLFAVNYTLKYPNGSVLSNHFNDSLALTTYYYYNAVDLNDKVTGTYSLNIKIWDDHTAIEIKDYKIKEVLFNDKKAYEIENGLYLAGDDLNKIGFFKTYDRYEFEVDFNKENPKIEVYARDLKYLSYSPYNAHFVSLELNKWLDFEANVEYSVKQIGIGYYEIQFITPDKKIKFKSIGDLNTIDYTYNFTYYDSFYVFARDNDLNTTIDEFTATAYNGSIQQTKTTTTGAVAFNLSGFYNINFTSAVYQPQTDLNVNFTLGASYTAYLNLSNAFRVYIRDQVTNNLIEPQIVYLEFIGTNSSNYSTTTGFKFITDLNPDDYIIRYNSEGYSTAFHYFELVNGSNVEFTIYMILNTTSTPVYLYVYDEDSNPVEDATIIVYRYSKPLNSYIEVHNLRTDFEGKAIVYLSLNQEFYKFFIYYNDILKLQTKGAYVTDTELTFNIILKDPILQDYFTQQDVDGYVSFNEDTLNFRFWYNDPSARVTQGCLYLYQVTHTGESLFNSSCVSSNSALILLTAQNISGMTYTGKGYIKIDDTTYFFDSYTFTFQQDSGYGTTGLIMIVFLTLVCGLAFLSDIQIGLILLPLPTLIGSLSFVNWINIPTHYALGVEVIFIVIALIIKGK